jgi:hypothetical protein
MNKSDVIVLTAIGVMALVAVIAPEIAYSEKNPQSECIKGQNQIFIGKEQSGGAYQSSKDTCQSLSK